MNHNRSSKIISVIALTIALFGLTLGFAAFSTTLSISSSAYINPNDENFIIKFVEHEQPIYTSDGTSATEANISDTTISGLKATLKAPGDYVTYKFNVSNAGQYDAYLNSISYENPTDATSYKVCTATNGTNATLVSAACEEISLIVTVGNSEFNGSQSVSSHKLAQGASEEVTVTIKYAADTETHTAARADGDFSVAFGNIVLDYGTVD